MRRDSRLSVALHILLHMEELGRVITSEALGPMTGMNPVVVRRTFAGLRDAGIVRAEKGHGGGWSLARPLSEVSLGDVYDALGAPSVFGIGPRDEQPRCLLEQAVDRAIGQVLEEARALLLGRLRDISVADIAAEACLPSPASRQQPKRTKKKRETHA